MRSPTTRYFLWLLVAALLLGCLAPGRTLRSSAAPEQPDRPLVIDEPSWFSFGDGHFYAYLAHILGRRIGDEEASLVRAAIENTGQVRERVTVRVELAPWASPVSRELQIDPGQRVAFDLSPSFDLEKLYRLTTPVPTEARLVIRRENGRETSFSKRLILEPVTRVRWAMPSRRGDTTDMRPLLVTLVTPSDRGGTIHKLIRDAASYLKPPVMRGYQSGKPAEVRLQAKALYMALQRRRYTYTSVGETFFDQTQRVRVVSQSLAQRSGNCVDATLVFASAFEALGMEPLLVFVRGHILVAVRTAPGSSNVVFIETTVLSSATFEQASALGYKVYQEAQRTGDPNLLMVDVKNLRAAGFLPIGM